MSWTTISKQIKVQHRSSKSLECEHPKQHIVFTYSPIKITDLQLIVICIIFAPTKDK